MQVFEKEGKSCVPFGRHGLTIEEEQRLMKVKAETLHSELGSFAGQGHRTWRGTIH